ncbi:MAG: ABC transporter permease subunit, partial [Candidatus Dormibacteria bacterium]
FDARVESAADLPRLLRQAWRAAMTGTPRPAHLDLNGLQAEIIETGTVHATAGVDPVLQLHMPPHRPTPSDADIERAAATLRAAGRIAIVAGAGATASQAGSELLALGQALAAPIGTSLGARGIIPTRHALSIGCVGSYAAPPANQIVHEAELFAFIAAVGNFGLITGLLSRVGLNPYDHGFSLYTLTGLTVVYLYFLVPLMVLVILPAVDGLQRQWFEASASLGAQRRHFWRYVGMPVLAPAFLAALLVLFVDAFAAYATADAITDGLIPLVPIKIGSLVAGNVLPVEAHLGAALGLGMIVIVTLAATIYAVVQRRTARWMR